MKIYRLVVVSLVLVGVFLLNFSALLADDGPTVDAQIDTFMKERGIVAESGTDQYLQFMKDILLGEYPDLTTIGSKYVETQEDLDRILSYATDQMSPLFKDFPAEADSPEATPASDDAVDQEHGDGVLAYSRTNAIKLRVCVVEWAEFKLS